MWYTKHAKVVGVAVAVSATCLVALLALGGCSETGAGGGGGGGGGGGAPPQSYEETLSDGTNVAVLSPVSVTLTEATPGSYPDGAAGPVVDIDGNLGAGQTATVTFTKDPGESPFPAGTSILHNDGGPYWSVEQTDTSVDRMSISATVSDFSLVGDGIPVEEVQVSFEEVAAFMGETVTVNYTVSPAGATFKAVNVGEAGSAAEATDLDADDGEIQVYFDGEGYGEITIHSLYEAETSFSVLSIQEIVAEEDPVDCRVRPLPEDPGENYYYVDDLTPGQLYVASVELPTGSGYDRQVTAATVTFDSDTHFELTAPGGHAHDAEDPLINYYITSQNDTAPLLFRADAGYQYFVVTDGSDGGDLDFEFELSVELYTNDPSEYLRIETYEPENDTENDAADTSMVILTFNADSEREIAAGAFDVSDTIKFSRLIVDEETLEGFIRIIAVAGQREFRDDGYDPTGGYAIMIANNTDDTTLSVDADYDDEAVYEGLDDAFLDGTGACVEICDSGCEMSMPGTRLIGEDDTNLMEGEADFMFFLCD